MDKNLRSVHDLDVLQDVMCEKETWFKPQLDSIIPEFISVRSDRN